MSVLREPVSRYGPALATSSASSRLGGSKRAIVKPQVQQLEKPLNGHYASLAQNLVTAASSSKVVEPSAAINARQMQTGIYPELNQRPIRSRSFASTSRRATGDLSTRKGRAAVPKRSIATSTKLESQDSETCSTSQTDLNMPALAPYDYSTYSPTPIRRYIRSNLEANSALDLLTGPLAFDMEWNVAWGRKVQRPVAVIQLASPKQIFILQICAMKGFPQKLKEILEDPTIVKMGVNIRGDAIKLFKEYEVKAQNLVELTWLSNCADPDADSKARRLVSLKTLIGKYLKKDLEKDAEGTRLSNWERLLSEDQQQYASNDVHSSVILYNHLIDLASRHKLALNTSDFTLNVSLDGKVVKAVEPPTSTTIEPGSTNEEPRSDSQPVPTDIREAGKPLDAVDSDEEVERIFARFQHIQMEKTHSTEPTANGLPPMT